MNRFTGLALLCLLPSLGSIPAAEPIEVVDTDDEIKIATPTLEATIRTKGYVSGVAAGSLVDKKTGFRDAGFGLDIVDWIMEPGSDAAYRDKLPQEMVYQFGNDYHGQRPKRSIEGPQICTKAKELSPEVIRGKDFVAITQSFQYQTAAPGKKTGSTWTQTIVFPEGKRYFVSSDRIDAVNGSEAMFLRIDMPGHIKHKAGDSFSEVFLSYFDQPIPSKEFLTNFAPDEKFNYRRDAWEEAGKKLPGRIIRGYRLRDPATGKEGPWLLGMTLDPAIVSEAWCHQRGYVCMIEEFGERPIKAGEHFSAAFIVGYFDSIEDANKVYDQHRDHSGLTVDATGWRLTK
ncbi:MAG TPA: hypothetical protein VFV87_16315 [Pirellulaceae bacterium]|nr:hypothetical protein [Pirellulaceae bacterium]